MPFICFRRTDIENGVLQVKDLWPNKSQANPVIDPKPQGPRYIRNHVEGTVATQAGVGGGSSLDLAAEVSGLAAYLIANIEDQGVGTPAITATAANTIAAALITRQRTGVAMASADINTVIAATVAASGIGIGNSTAAVDDILSILAGGVYTLPALYNVQDAAGAFVPSAGNDAYFDEDTYRHLLGTDSLLISMEEGDLSVLSSASFSYKGTTGAAVVVYDDAGNLY